MKKGEVARDHKTAKRLSLPPEFPAFEELESLAAAETPNLAAAWWITYQITEHVFSAIGKIDTRTGAPLSQPLTEIFEAIRQVTVTGCRPFPHDQLYAAAQFAAKPLEKLLARYRHRIVRAHEQLPFHQIREVDTRSMAWLTRQPGRNVREKLSGRTHALGVKRSVTADTTENRLLQSFAKLLTQRANDRLTFSDAYDATTGDEDRVKSLRDCMILCDERMQHSELADVPTVTRLQPNNVLLSDPLYSRVFRAWKWLRDDENSLLETWPATFERTRILLYWMVAAHLASQDRIVVTESLGRIHAGRGEGHVFGVELLGTEGDRAAWQLNPELHFLVQPIGYKDFAFQIRLSVKGEYIIAHMVALAGQGALHEESTSEFAFKVKAAPEKLKCKRGIGIVVEGLETAGNGYADIAGLSGFAELMAGQVLKCCGVNFTKWKNKQIHSVAEKNTARLGLELGNTFIFVTAECPIPISTAAWTIALEIPNEVNSFEWLDGRDDCHVVNGAAARSLWTSGDVFEADEQTDAGMLALSVNRLLESIKDELHTTTDTRIAYAVPDFIDEFSQRSLSSAFAGSFHQPVPVWRSVAAAMGWVSTKGALIQPGESILVVDAEFMEVSQTVLTARFDDKLKRLHPTSNGIFWERKPPLPLEENSELLGWPHVLREYAHRIVDLALPSIPEDQKNRITDDLLHTDTISNLVQLGGSVLIQITSNSGSAPTIVELFEDCEWFDSYVGKWINVIVNGINASCKTVKIDHVLLTGGSFGCERFQQSKSNIGRILNFDQGKGFGFIETDKTKQSLFVHLSSVQKGAQLKSGDHVCFDIGDGRKGPEAKGVEIISPLTYWLTDRITISPLLMSLGARECLLRLDTECITWREWLPELSLELIRDGHYGELQLLKSVEYIDPFLGNVIPRTFSEKLMLTRGVKWFSLPLLVGQQGHHTLAWNARLESLTFPLDQDVEVELSMSYHCGWDTRCDLSVVPVTKTNAPFERIVAKWKNGDEDVMASSSLKPFNADYHFTRCGTEDFAKLLVDTINSIWFKVENSKDPVPENVKKAFQSFHEYLFELQSPIRSADQVPTKLIELFLQIDKATVDDKDWFKETTKLLIYLVGDGASKRTVLLHLLLNHLRRHTNFDAFNASLARVSMQAIGNAAWRHREFATSLVTESGAVKLIVERSLKSLNHLLRVIPMEINSEDERDSVRKRYGLPFCDTCQLLLALLRVDRANPEVTLLKLGSSTADALAKVIRRLDARFAAINIVIRWRVQINTTVDKALHRMSPIAFTLNRYLAEGADSNLIKIRSLDDD